MLPRVLYRDKQHINYKCYRIKEAYTMTLKHSPNKSPREGKKEKGKEMSGLTLTTLGLPAVTLTTLAECPLVAACISLYNTLTLSVLGAQPFLNIGKFA